GGAVVEEEAEPGVRTIVCSSRLATTCGDILIFGHIKVPLGLQIRKLLFSLSIFAALSSTAVLPSISFPVDPALSAFHQWQSNSIP
ncbi:hypothetical protein L195_g057326, partial [Trifolium pratense]